MVDLRNVEFEWCTSAYCNQFIHYANSQGHGPIRVLAATYAANEHLVFAQVAKTVSQA